MRSVGLLPFLGLVIGCTRTLASQGNGDPQLQAFVNALNTGSQSQIKQYLETAFVPSLATDDFASRILKLSEIGLPVRLGKMLVDEPTTKVASLTSSSGENWELKMTFEPNTPHLANSVLVVPPGSLAHPPIQYDHWTDLTDLLTQIRKDNNLPAIGLALFDHGHVQSAVVGKRDINLPESAKLTDCWLIGSVTKSMTSTLIARLVDKGLLKWDSTLGEIFPSMPMRSQYKQVTLLQLLQHRAGIQQDRLVSGEFVEEAAGPSRNFEKIRAHYTQFTLNRAPLSKPGEKMAYSNAGYAIAAHIAETVGGKPYEALIKELVFDPIGMTSAHFGVPGMAGNPGAPGQINGHSMGKEGPQNYIMNDARLVGMQEGGGLGMAITLGDLLKFEEFHLSGLQGRQNLISAKNFAVLHAPGDSTPGASQYACGWVIDDSHGTEPFHGHNGTDGSFFAEVAIWPKRNLAVVSVTNIGIKASLTPPMQAILAVYRRAIK